MLNIEMKIGEPFWFSYDYGEGLAQKCYVRKVYGICNELYNSEDNSVLIDNSIVDLIVLLNKKGFTTWCCCSGLDVDHFLQESEGYLAFGNAAGVNKISEIQWQILKSLAFDAGFDSFDDVDGEWYSKTFRTHGTDEEKKAVWDRYYKLIENL